MEEEYSLHSVEISTKATLKMACHTASAGGLINLVARKAFLTASSQLPTSTLLDSQIEMMFSKETASCGL
jgi:hypothetical protein